MYTGHLGRPGTKKYTEHCEGTCPYNGIRFANKKEQSTYTCHNMDEPQKDAMWTRSTPKRLHLNLILFIWNVQKKKSREIENRWVVSWSWELEEHEVCFWSDNLVVAMVVQFCKFTKKNH